MRRRSPSPRDGAVPASPLRTRERSQTQVFGLKRVAAIIAAVLLGAFCLYAVSTGSTMSGFVKSNSAQSQLMPALTAAVAHAAKAGKAIVELRTQPSLKQAGKEPVTIADETSNNILMQMPLGRTIIISEEGVEGGELPVVKDNEVIVFVDPLDATQEYTEELTQYVSIQICFSRCGQTVAALLYFPFTGRTMLALPKKKYYAYASSTAALAALTKLPAQEYELLPAPTCDCDTQRAKIEAFQPVELSSGGALRRPKQNPKPLKVIVTRSHFRNESRSSSGTLSMRTALQVLGEVYPNMQLIKAGGAGYKLAAVITGDADVYLHDGPIRMWDVCAGAALLSAKGGFVSDWIGEPHTYCTPVAGGSKKVGYAVRGIVATRDQHLHKEVLDVIYGKMKIVD